MELTDEQQNAFRIAMSGRNCLITGPGGVGKSTVLKKFVMTKTLAASRVFVTAPTGVAALNIRGETLHRAFGISPHDTSASTLITRIKKSPGRMKMLQMLETLIIDEISMVNPKLFTMLDVMLRSVRYNTSVAFGGVQVVMFGDFFQLPPVGTSGEEVEFVFESEAWKDARPIIVEMTTSVRHQDDIEYSEMLKRFRVGVTTPEDLAMLNSTCRTDGVEDVTHMMTTNVAATRHNNSKLEMIPEPVHTIEASSWHVGAIHPSVLRLTHEKLLRNLNVPLEFVGKTGAKVMSVYNIAMPLGIANGTVGTVVGWGRPEDKEVRAHRLGECVDRFDEIKKIEDAYTLNVYERGQLYPIVEFPSARITVMIPHVVFMLCPYGERDFRRVYTARVPLRLAWAITIHKSQGATLEQGHVNPRRLFEAGQLYVALSRVRTLQGLSISSPITAAMCVAHPKLTRAPRRSDPGTATRRRPDKPPVRVIMRKRRRR